MNIRKSLIAVIVLLSGVMGSVIIGSLTKPHSDPKPHLEVNLHIKSDNETIQYSVDEIENKEILSEISSQSFPILNKEGLSTAERIKELRILHGKELSPEQHAAALLFLRGKTALRGVSISNQQWISDELLTLLRLETPRWDNLVEELGKISSLKSADPVVKDYIVQHLGHIWEEYGDNGKIQSLLWEKVNDSQEGTTIGSSLNALNRGFEREQDTVNLRKLQQIAYNIADDEKASLPARVTALLIASNDIENTDVKFLAERLFSDPETPYILKNAANNVLLTIR